MFPEVDLAHLRHTLLSASNSYLYTSLSKLLFDPTLSPIDVLSPDQRTKHSGKGKRRLEPLPKRQHPGEITYADLIKDDKYAESALAMLCAQFPNVWKSSIKAIMVSASYS